MKRLLLATQWARRFFLMMLLTATAQVAWSQEGVYGDVNGDGLVNASDLEEIVAIINGEKRGPQPTGIEVIDTLPRDMIAVAGGTFTMGATADQGSDTYEDESPVHEVTLSSFKLCRIEVTQALWEAVMGSNPSETVGALLPVTNVSWDDCQSFITRLNEMTGHHYRLPTEAEWEYAARGGDVGTATMYAGSDVADEVAWYSDNSGNTVHAVAGKKANELGLHDMSGNVNEWCNDWYGSYSEEAVTDPQGPESGTFRVFRGGAWNYVVASCRCSIRIGFTPAYTVANVGLRLAE